MKFTCELEPFGTSVGLKQGDALSCILFNLALEDVVIDLGIQSKGTIYVRKHYRYLHMLTILF